MFSPPFPPCVLRVSPMRRDALGLSDRRRTDVDAQPSSTQIFIYDLNSPQTPFSPGTRSRSLDSITSLSWNPSVAHILASSSNSGATVVWDLKTKREVTALSYAGGGATGLGPAGFGGNGGNPFGPSGGGMTAGPGGLGGHSVVKWHPENVRRRNSSLFPFLWRKEKLTI